MKKISGRKLWMALCLALLSTAQAAPPAASPPPAAGAIKWHPGHYAAIERKQKANPAHLKGVYADLDATPALRGVQHSQAEVPTTQARQVARCDT